MCGNHLRGGSRYVAHTPDVLFVSLHECYLRLCSDSLAQVRYKKRMDAWYSDLQARNSPREASKAILGVLQSPVILRPLHNCRLVERLIYSQCAYLASFRSSQSSLTLLLESMSTSTTISLTPSGLLKSPEMAVGNRRKLCRHTPT